MLSNRCSNLDDFCSINTALNDSFYFSYPIFLKFIDMQYFQINYGSIFNMLSFSCNNTCRFLHEYFYLVLFTININYEE